MALGSVSRPGKALNDLVTSALRSHRQEQGLIIRQMAIRTGIPLGSFSCLETGRYRLSLENLLRILLTLGVGIQEVWPAKRHIVRVTDEALLDVISAARKDRPEALTLDQILDVVAQVCGFSEADLAGPSRHRDVAKARTIAALLVRDQPQLRLAQLAQRIRRDPSSLSHSMSRAEDLTRTHPFWRLVAEVRQRLG